MAEKIINKGEDYLLLPKNGYLQTVSGSDTYKLDKAVDIEFDLAPPYELRYSADLDFDLTPVGDVGSWSTSFPFTSDMVSTDKTLDSTSKDDAQTISYWMYKLMKKQYPQIQFREIMKDTQDSPKTITHNWDGILTRIKRTRGATKGTYDILMDGIIKKHVDLVNE